MSVMWMWLVVALVVATEAVRSAALNEEERAQMRSLITELIDSAKREPEIQFGEETREEVIPEFAPVPETEPTSFKRDSAKRADEFDLGGAFDARDEVPVFAPVPVKEPTPFKRGLEMNKRSSYEINMCYFCDSTCRRTLGMTKGQVKAWLSDVTAGVQTRLQSLMGPSSSVSRHGFLLDFPLPGSSYLMFKSQGMNQGGVDLLTNIATNFWDTWKPRPLGGASLNDYLLNNGCDVNFLIVSKYDNVWTAPYAGDVAGQAYTMGVCQGTSYGMVNLETDAEKMATLIAHETGHLLGISHDGALATMWSEHCSAYPGMPACGPLLEHCTASNAGCADADGCVMEPAIDTNAQFSECSKAYWHGFLALTQALPDVFSVQCIAG